MIYGDIQFIDLLIFAGIAGFLIYRLRSVLGKRVGHLKKDNIQNERLPVEKNKQIPELKDSEIKLKVAYQAYSEFDHKDFLNNAKFAFETIINAFNKSDKKTLKNLLTKDVYSSFEQAIDNKENNPTFQFYSLVINSVEEVIVEKNLISITLKITSEQFKDDDEKL